MIVRASVLVHQTPPRLYRLLSRGREQIDFGGSRWVRLRILGVEFAFFKDERS